jgi:FkbM family methyltransferase
MRRELVLVMALVTVGCGSAGVEDSAPITANPSLATCESVRDADEAVRTRKDRIAKGVFYASRRLEVDGGLELWDTPYGRFWVVAENFRTFAEVLAEQAVDIYGDETRGVHAGDVVLDAGAHFGGFARTALARGAKLVVAIEIAPENVACLRRNFVKEIAAGRVIVYEKGVWDKDDTMVLQRRNNTWADGVSEGGDGSMVAVTTVDKIVTELKLPSVDFIKMDIEGAERHALTGAAATLARYKPRMAIAAYHEADDLDVLPGIARASQSSYDVCVSGRQLGHGYTTLFYR